MRDRKSTKQMAQLALTGATVMTALALTPQPSRADLMFSDVSISLRSDCGPCAPPVTKLVTVPPSDTTVYETLINVADSSRQPFAPFRPGGLSGLFVSSAMSAENPVGMSGGVGISGIFQGNSLQSFATYQQKVTNDGNDAVETIIRAKIPQISLLLYGEDNIDSPVLPDDGLALAFAEIEFQIRRAVGDPEIAFDYFAGVEKLNFKNDLSSLRLEMDTDLQEIADADPSFVNPIEVKAFPNAPFSDARVSGYTFDEITVDPHLLRLAPNETVELFYQMRVFAVCGNTNSLLCDDDTGGVHAAVGDPFNLETAGPLIRFADAPDPGPNPNPLPAPNVALLVLAGLLPLIKKRCTPMPESN